MAILRQNLILKFKTTTPNEVHKVTILKPMDGINGTEIKTAMETIVAAAAIVSSTGGTVNGVEGAEYDIRQVETIELQ